MANETTSAQVAVFAQKVLDKAMQVAQADAAFMPGKPGFDFLRLKDITQKKAKSADFPKWGSVAFASQAETDDVATWQQMSANATTLTAGILTAPTFWTDLAEDSTDDDTAEDRGIAIGLAAAKKVDSDVCALFAGLTASVGATGVDLTFAGVQSAIGTLRNAEVPGPYCVVLHSEQWNNLVAESNSKFLDIAKFGPVAESAIKNYEAFDSLGARWIVTPRCPTANAGADVVGGVFGRGAFGFVWKWMPRIDTQQDISRGGGGYEFIGKMAYAAGELEDSYGVKLLSDAP